MENLNQKNDFENTANNAVVSSGDESTTTTPELKTFTQDPFAECGTFFSLVGRFHSVMGFIYTGVKPEAQQTAAREAMDCFRAKTADLFIQSHAEYMQGKKAPALDPAGHIEALQTALLMEGMTIQVVGFWIYCTGPAAYANCEELKAAGYWFSGTHKAWVFSGTKKRNIRPKKGHDAFDSYEAEIIQEGTAA